MSPDTDTNDSEATAQTRRRYLKTTLAAAVATSGVGTASASHEEGFFAGIEGVSGERDALAFANGLANGIAYRINGEQSGAKQNALDVKAEFNEHSADWIAYANNRGLGGADRQVLESVFVQEADNYRVYLVANYDEGADEYTSAEIVEKTNRSVDHKARLEGPAAENAASELQTLHEEYIVDNEDIDASHVQYLAGRYYLGPNSHITTTLLGGA